MEKEEFEVVAEFDHCPVCGSTERFVESLANKVKEKGLMREEYNFYFQYIKVPVVDPMMQHLVPVGGSVQAMVIGTDICSNCGCVYAVKLMKGSAQKRMPPVPPGFGRLGGASRPMGNN